MKTLALLFLTLFAASPMVSRAADAVPAPAGSPALRTAIFSMGCFWCAQDPFDKVKGITETVVGYAGGTEKDPTYEMVSAGNTGYRESIKVTFDPSKVSYDQLLDVFWHHINPTQTNGQFTDHEPQYTTAIFYADEQQKKDAEASRERLAKSGKFSKPIATVILPVTTFVAAEDYHQKYYMKNPDAYQAYHFGSGRVIYLKKTWGSAE